MNGLSQVGAAQSRQEFICGLIRGLGGNLTSYNALHLLEILISLESALLTLAAHWTAMAMVAIAFLRQF